MGREARLARVAAAHAPGGRGGDGDRDVGEIRRGGAVGVQAEDPYGGSAGASTAGAALTAVGPVAAVAALVEGFVFNVGLYEG